jgi:hypothetical protein
MTTDPRSRVVFFRVTEDEYRKLKEVSSRNGARSLSDFTRSELLACIHSGTITEHLHSRFESLEHRIDELQVHHHLAPERERQWRDSRAPLSPWLLCPRAPSLLTH